MGHDEAQARQDALIKFVRLIKASKDDAVSEVEAISFTGDITQLSNYELTVVIQQLQAQLFSNLNPHRPSGITASEPEPTPATPATPAVSVVEEPAAMNLLESFEYASNQVQNLRERMEQGDRKLYRSVGEYMDSTDSTIQNLAAEALEPEPAFAPKRLSLFILFEEVGLDSDALYEALKTYTKPALVRCARSHKIAGKTALDKFTTRQLIEELVKYAVREVNRGSCFLNANPPATPEPAPEPATPGLSWLDNPEAFTL